MFTTLQKDLQNSLGPRECRLSGDIFSGRGGRSRRRLEPLPVPRGERCRRRVGERAVRPHPVVLLAPRLDDLTRVIQADEPVLVQALVAELAIEALDVRVLHRRARAGDAPRSAERVPRETRALDWIADLLASTKKADAILAFTYEAFDVVPEDRPKQLRYVGPLACTPTRRRRRVPSQRGRAPSRRRAARSGWRRAARCRAAPARPSAPPPGERRERSGRTARWRLGVCSPSPARTAACARPACLCHSRACATCAPAPPSCADSMPTGRARRRTGCASISTCASATPSSAAPRPRRRGSRRCASPTNRSNSRIRRSMRTNVSWSTSPAGCATSRRTPRCRLRRCRTPPRPAGRRRSAGVARASGRPEISVQGAAVGAAGPLPATGRRYHAGRPRRRSAPRRGAATGRRRRAASPRRRRRPPSPSRAPARRGSRRRAPGRGW